ncbi:capsid cement protein [Vibrio sp. 1982]|uniref:capsid cement protein n=1 Tax=Vibrio sp. 1982 TaxID=3074586 RepID=UPI0029656479|nr:capsid cement protein [Vibrio sp. 1982]MDW2216212.1 DUF2190 family protein [Vibrio sp. 1982]
MAKNKQADGKTIDFVAAADHSSGALVEIGNMVAVVHENVVAGATGVGHVDGVWTLPKSEAVAINQGETVYVKNAVISKDNTGTYAGKAWMSADAAAAEIDVNINFG